MAGPSSDQLAEIEFISGVTATGIVAARSYASWNGDAPATYSSVSDEAKWGSSTAGTAGRLTVAFDPTSRWTAAEQQAFVSAMHLWSAVADVHFDLTYGTSTANLVISRTSDREAQETDERFYRGREGTPQLGVLLKTSIGIDTSVAGFGPIGGSLATAGGYPWMTIEHEIGHAIGLGHAGAYNADPGDSGSYPSLGVYDDQAWSLMSYQDDGPRSPTTPMVLDIAAAQRLYGTATDSPLSGGGQVFGFHSNITGDIAAFYDFSVNTAPFVTIWDGGANNTLDLSGFSTWSRVSLEDGSVNSVGGLANNLGIAFGTRIETVIGGSGSDELSGNALGDLIQGGAGADTLTGGGGNDHIYGNLRSTQQGASDGDDVIDTGGGNDYVNGNAGADRITAWSGDNRLYGGAGDDTITTQNGNDHINGNAGNDQIYAYARNDTVFGGQGNDYIHLGGGNGVVSGDLGDDRIFFGSGYVLATGGAGRDVFDVGDAGATRIDRGGELAGYVDEITDFQPGSDLIWFARTITDVLHDPADARFASVADARAEAQALLQAHPGTAEAAAVQVGSDTYLFWNDGGVGDAVNAGVKLDGVSAAAFTVASISHDPAVLR